MVQVGWEVSKTTMKRVALSLQALTVGPDNLKGLRDTFHWNGGQYLQCIDFPFTYNRKFSLNKLII